MLLGLIQPPNFASSVSSIFYWWWDKAPTSTCTQKGLYVFPFHYSLESLYSVHIELLACVYSSIECTYIRHNGPTKMHTVTASNAERINAQTKMLHVIYLFSNHWQCEYKSHSSCQQCLVFYKLLLSLLYVCCADSTYIRHIGPTKMPTATASNVEYRAGATRTTVAFAVRCSARIARSRIWCPMLFDRRCTSKVRHWHVFGHT